MNSLFTKRKNSGYTLIELMISVGLFALVMALAAGAYLVIIGISRQTQGVATGIDNLSFALETMTRTIRTGTGYSCSAESSAISHMYTDCPSGGPEFSVTNSDGENVTYTVTSTVNGNAITQATTNADGTVTTIDLTDPLTVTIPMGTAGLAFYAKGTDTARDNDATQAQVTIVVSGTVSSGVAKGSVIPFTVETGATMRGSDL